MMPVLIAALVLLAIYMGGCLWGFRYACARIQDPDWEDPESLAKTIWKDHPISIPGAIAWLREHNAQEVTVESHDGLTLRGKWVPAEKPIGTIVIFHGYHSNYVSDYGGIFQQYHDWGLNLLLCRQRSHGESDGSYITFGVKERLDVLTWLQFHNRVHGVDNVYLGGISMGASTVMYAAGEDLPPNVRGIVADCGFTSPREILTLVAGNMKLPGRLMVPGVCLWAKVLDHTDLLFILLRQVKKNLKQL